MRAFAYRLRLDVRKHATEMVGLVCVVAVGTALVLAMAAGVARTRTAPDRYVRHFDLDFDVLVTQSGDRPSVDEIDDLPSVDGADSVSFVYGGLIDPEGRPYPALTFSGDLRPIGLHIVDGRLPGLEAPSEFVATRSFADATAAEIGDRLELRTLTDEQVAEAGFRDPGEEGRTHEGRLVGIVDGLSRLDDPSPLAVFSSALLDDPMIGIADTMHAVDLRPGSDPSALRSELDRVEGGGDVAVAPAMPVSETVARSVDVQAHALAILAIGTALGVIVAVGQLLTRRVQLTDAERLRLSAIGLTRRQMMLGAVARATTAIVLGTAVGAIAATAGSSFFPTGFVRSIEPDRGTDVDAPVLVGGGALLVTALVSWVTVGIATTRRHRSPTLLTPLLDRVARALPTPSATTGVRFAFTRTASDRSAAWSSVVGGGAVIATVVAAATFGSALDRLIDEPARYGVHFDAAIGDNGAAELPADLARRLQADERVVDLTSYALADLRAGDLTVPTLGFDIMKGFGAPELLDGRLPEGDDEVAFGARSARQLGVGVGERVQLAGPGSRSELQITGLVIMPGFGPNDGVGDGALMTSRGLALLDPDARPLALAVDVVGDPSAYVEPEFWDVETGAPIEPFVPAVITNLARVRSIPYVLAAVIAVLAAMTVSHVVVMSVRNRRRDLAVLRTLGARRTWVARVLHWQATAFAGAACSLGLMAGLVAGRWVFAAYARNMGVDDSVGMPGRIVLLYLTMIVVLANVAARLVTLRARQQPPARTLHAE